MNNPSGELAGDASFTANLSSQEQEVGNSSSEDFSSLISVDKGGNDTIETRFEALIETRRELPTDWYKDLDMDKSLASKIRRGLIIPNESWRIKIAGHFQVDSTVIWKPRDIILFKELEDKND